MTVKTFKLITGEEVIAELHNDELEYVEILRPVALVETEAGNVSLVPWLFSVDIESPIRLDHEKIFLIADANGAFIEAYQQYDRSLKMYQEDLKAMPLDELDDEELEELITIH